MTKETGIQTEESGVVKKILFLLLLLVGISPFGSPPLALFLGIVTAWTIGHPFPSLGKTLTSRLLQFSIVGLGFGIHAEEALAAGKEGFLFTVGTIVGTLVLGALIGRLLQVDRKASYLISSGTAICGGSAIAAVAPVIRAEEKQISIALGTVFILNAVALFIFPPVGTYFHLSQSQFGLWAAIAIHDTSSVVGAAAKYGDEALRIATTVKLARALWIIPVALISGFFFKSDSQKIKIPYFIGLFVLAILANTYIPAIQKVGEPIVFLAKKGLTATLFLIGAGLSRKNLASVGVRPVLQGVLLWIFISIVSFFIILAV